MVLHQIYGRTAASHRQFVGNLEADKLHPPPDPRVDATAAFYAVMAPNACGTAWSSLNLHFISARDSMPQGMVRLLYWVDIRDMLADGFTKGGIDRALLGLIPPTV